MSSVFLSHNSKDKPFVRKLAERLTSDGVVVWLDEAELNIGDSLIEKISDGIQKMEYVAAIISTNSIESSWVQKEISLAMSKEIAGRRVTVLPILIEKCTVPVALADKLYADFTAPENFEIEYSKILCAVGLNSASPAVNRHQTNTTESRISDVSKPNQIDNIRIIGVARERTRQDPKFSGLQDYFFQLSAQPPTGWSNFFDKIRSFPRHTMWRQAWIEGDCVVIKTSLDELGSNLEELKEDVAKAHTDYVKAKEATDRKKRQEKEQKERAKKGRDDVLNKLDFD